MDESKVPTEEIIQEKLDMVEEPVDGRTALGKRLKAIEDTLADHEKRIDECSIRR